MKGAPNKLSKPKRIKRDATRELFPSLAVESQAQDKLIKLANSISGFNDGSIMTSPDKTVEGMR